MEIRLLKKLRRKGRSQVTIYSIIKEGGINVGMSYGYNSSNYSGLFEIEDSEKDVLRKAEKIYIENYLGKLKPIK